MLDKDPIGSKRRTLLMYAIFDIDIHLILYMAKILMGAKSGPISISYWVQASLFHQTAFNLSWCQIFGRSWPFNGRLNGRPFLAVQIFDRSWCQIHVNVQPFSLDIKNHLYAASHLPSYTVLHSVCFLFIISNTGGVHCTTPTLSVDILVCALTVICALKLFCALMVLVHDLTVFAHVLKGLARTSTDLTHSMVLARASMILACYSTVLPCSMVLPCSTVLTHALMVLTHDLTRLSHASTILTGISVAVYSVSSLVLHETRCGQYSVLGVSTLYL